jgi:hypothetical protein
MSGDTKGIALITGASAGIGAVYADRLARQGHDLILVARNSEKLNRLARSIAGGTGRLVQVLQADLVDPADLRRVETVLRTNQGISMLVNNAGVGATQPLLESDVDAMEAMIDLNVTALTRLAYAAAPTFVDRGSGTIVNIASVVGIVPELLNGVYGASKSFVIALSQSLHHELAGRGVRVQAVLPGATATDFWDVAGTPLEALPAEMVMTADALVDAALAGLEQGELITIPSLPDAKDYERLEAARIALKPNLSLAVPAARYTVPSDAHDLRALAHAS